MSHLTSLLIAGAVSGALYSLIASGLVLSYSATGIFNLGYGAIAFVAAFLYFELHMGLGWPIVPAALVSVFVLGPALGYLLDVAIFRRLTRASESAKVMATVGVLIALPAIAKWAVYAAISTGHAHIPSGDQIYLAPGVGPSPSATYHLGLDVSLSSDQLIVLATAVVAALGLWFIMRKTSLGLNMRAMVDRPDLAQMRGINRGRTSATAWMIGATLASLAGVIGSPIFNSLDPGTYEYIIFVAIAAAAIGGLRSIPLAFAGGIVLGMTQSLVAGYATFASSIHGFNAAVPFVVMLIALSWYGQREGGRQKEEPDEQPGSYEVLQGVRSRRKAALMWIIGLGAVLAYVDFIANAYWISITTAGLALAIVFLSYTIVVGLGGIVSLAQAAFVTGAGLVTGLATQYFHVPWVIGILCGIAAASLLGLIVTVPALKLGGLSFALASLAVGFLGDKVLFSWSTLNNKNAGWVIAAPWHLGSAKVIASVCVIVIILCVGAISVLERGQLGRMMLAVRSSESAAAAAGISVPMVKLAVFVASASMAGLGGVLIATVQQSADNQAFTTTSGLVWIATVVLWGIRRPVAAVIAGISSALFGGILISGIHWWNWVPSGLSWGGTKNVWIPQAIFGLGAIQMAKDPDGILALLPGLRRKRARAPGRDDVSDDGHRSSAPVMPTAPLHLELEEPMQGSAIRPDLVSDGVAQPESYLAIRRLSGGYGMTRVLEDITLDLSRHSITALVGPNGAGKSTLAATIAGLLPPTSGTITFLGSNIVSAAPHERARAGICVAPEGRGIFPGLSVDDNLAIRLPSARQRLAVYREFPALGMRRQLPARSLSGGEQQMLSLSSLLVEPPLCLIADEPTLGLAPLVIADVKKLLIKLRNMDVSILLIEEKAGMILDISDRVAILSLGRVSWYGDAADVTRDQLAAAFFA